MEIASDATTAHHDLSAASREYLARAPLARRKALGQYFTPAALREDLLEGVRLPRGARILDPACGTGEFFHTARRLWPQATLTGWEIDPELVERARAAAPFARVEARDALVQPFAPAFDAVIGNPPFFEFKPTPELRARYAPAISGRPNSYALFVQLGLELLRPGGVLAYVLPPSMNNGAYFRGLRAALLARARVESLRVLRAPNLFEGANQTVMLLRLVKGEADDGRHVWRRGPFTLFCEEPAALDDLFEGTTTLDQLGYRVRTGSVVWNQARARLTDDPRGAVRLLWSHDIGPDGLRDEPRPGKPRYVRAVQPRRGPALVVNRVTGAGRRARLRVGVVPRGMEFAGENHVNVVIPPPGTAEAEVRRVAAALLEPRAAAAVCRITGNTQVSSVELAHLVPLSP